MTLQVQSREIIHTGNGVTTQFPFTFPMKRAEHLAVTLYDSETKTYSVVSSSNYTLLGGINGPGTVTFRYGGLPISSRYKLILTRTVPYTQDADIYNQDGFHPEVVENQLDLIVMMIQQLSSGISRLVQVPLDEQSTLIPNIALRKDKYLGFDTLGVPVALAAPVAFTDTSLLRFSARNAVQAATIDSGTKIIFLNGYTTEGDGGAARYKQVASEPVHAAKVQSANGIWFENDERLLTSAQTGGASNLALAGYTTKALILVKTGETANLACDPTGGDSFSFMASWLAASAIKEEGATAALQIADGLHEIVDYFNLTAGKQLNISGSAAADTLQINSVTFTPLGSGMYTTVIGVSTALPARVVVGYCLGAQNCKGDGGAEAINGAHAVEAIAGDRLSFTTTIYVDADAVAPTNTTVFDNTTTLGLAANKIIVPQCCLRADSSAWDGTSAAEEGFINLLYGGAQIYILNVGFTYNGASDEHDMFFARGGGASLSIYGCVIAGAGDKIVRVGSGAHFDVFGTCMGGGTTGRDGAIAQLNSSGVIQRCSIGSLVTVGVSALDSSHIEVNQSIIVGPTTGVRTTYLTASVVATNGRIAHCHFGAQVTAGTIQVDTLLYIKKCKAPISMAGVGVLTGNPNISDCTDAAIPSAVWINGGYWNKDGIQPGVMDSSAFSINFGSLAAGATEVATLSYPGARLGDYVEFSRSNNIPSGEEDIDIKAWVSATDQVTMRAKNNSGGTVNPAAASYYVRVSFKQTA